MATIGDLLKRDWDKVDFVEFAFGILFTGLGICLALIGVMLLLVYCSGNLEAVAR